MYCFNSDYTEGCHPAILEKLVATNMEQTTGYGMDAYCDEARELIKIKVLLETSPEKPKEIAQKLAEATNSECVGVIGGSMIFYRYNPELHKDEKKKGRK